MALADKVLIEAHENYQKQSYRNRCYVLTSNKIDCLTVPVLGSSHRQPIRDVRIDYSQHWIERHLRCLQSAYAKSPYFDYLMPEIEQILYQRHFLLFDLNWSLLTLCRKWLRINNPIRLTEWYEKTPPTGVFDARSLIEPGQHTQIGLFGPISRYQQNFGAEFVSNLSVLDLMFAGETMSERDKE